MPRPPPPPTAFSITAPSDPSDAKNARASSNVIGRLIPGNTGTPHSSAKARACALSPKRRSVCGVGPTNTRPAASQASANSAASLKNP